MENQLTQKYNIKAMLRVGVAIIAISLIQYFFFKSPSVDEMMMKAAREMNKTCPIMVDQITRMEDVVALRGRIFQFNYTSLEMNLDSLDLETIKNNLKPLLVNNVKTGPKLKLFRDKEITMVYNYRDIYGNFLFKISVGPDDYKNL